MRLRVGVLGSLFGVALGRSGIVKDTDFLTREAHVPLRRQDEGAFRVQLVRLFGEGLSSVNVSFSSSLTGDDVPGLAASEASEECAL